MVKKKMVAMVIWLRTQFLFIVIYLSADGIMEH